MADDRELYERFVRGDPGAFETLFLRHQREVFGWVYRIIRNQGEAEELTVETFWRIYAARARFDPTRSFGPWARRIATNVALNGLRAQRHHEPLAFEPAAPGAPDPAERAQMRRRLAAAFHRLSPKLRLVAILALVEEVPYGEIAQALGLSHEAVKSRVFRAVRKLRKALTAKGITP